MRHHDQGCVYSGILVSEGKSTGITAERTAVGRQAGHGNSSWELISYLQVGGREGEKGREGERDRELGIMRALESSKFPSSNTLLQQGHTSWFFPSICTNCAAGIQTYESIRHSHSRHWHCTMLSNLVCRSTLVCHDTGSVFHITSSKMQQIKYKHYYLVFPEHIE